MSEVLALIAHDLKNALGALEAELATLAGHPDRAAAHAAHLHCQNLRQDFVQFLTLYGAENGQLRALCEDEAPQDLLDSLQTRWQARLQAEGRMLTLHQASSDHAPAFHHFDRRLVYMALDAAIHNASRFARSRIDLSVQAQVRQGHNGLLYTVEDDGPGLGHHDHLSSATGLGTALCQAIAGAHRLGAIQGHAQLADRPSTGGCCFSLWLP